MELPNEFNNLKASLRDWARGGLNQMAYGGSHQLDYSAPRNLDDFKELLDPTDASIKRYRAYYRFNMAAHEGRNVKAANNCQYNYHNLSLFTSILQTISTNAHYSADAHFTALYYKLLYNRSAGDTRSCNNRPSIPSSLKQMTGFPLAEFYYGAKANLAYPSSCTKGESAEFTTGSSETTLGAARLFFDSTYTNCKL